MNAESEPSIHDLEQAGLQVARDAIAELRDQHPRSSRLRKDAELCGILLLDNCSELTPGEISPDPDPVGTLLIRYAPDYSRQISEVFSATIRRLHIY